MKISENWAEKAVLAIQAVVVVVFVWFTLWQELKQKQKSARRLQAVHEKETIRYTKAKFKRKRKGLKKSGLK